MAWEIVSDTDVANYVRFPVNNLRDAWYDQAIGIIEGFTGWSLTEENNITEVLDGTGTSDLKPEKIPISSVTSINISGINIPTSYYYVTWSGIKLKSHRDFSVQLSSGLYEIIDFPYGVANITIEYSCGGFNILPRKYQEAIKAATFMIIKEYTVIPRSEGSDQVMRTYRPDRTMLPEEVLMNYGTHGKIRGILNAMLPQERLFA